MGKKSAGILLYRLRQAPEVFLVHPGGPFFSKKDKGVWSIPKGELTENEDPLQCAKREFNEETGTALSGNFTELTPIKQKGGKAVYAWAIEGDIDAEHIQSNMFELEWPPKSGKKQLYPEVDKAEWFSIPDAITKINPAQAALLDELITRLGLAEE